MPSGDLTRRLSGVPSYPLAPRASPIEEMPRLRAAIGCRARLFVKRDDAIEFAFGGNKVRKMRYVLAQAVASGADTLITTGGIQSNHARVTAAAAAVAGMRCVIVANGAPPARPTANALLDRLLGAEVRYVRDREDRSPAMEAVARELARAGRRPFVIPLGASTPRGALGFVHAAGELAEQCAGRDLPDLIVLAASSGGTQAGLLAGCRAHGLATRIIGVSADEPAVGLAARIDELVSGVEAEIGLPAGRLAGPPAEVDDSFIGGGYGVPTEASREAADLAARTEALFVDHTYTAKALAALLAYARGGRLDRDDSVLFWHTGGQVALFA